MQVNFLDVRETHLINMNGILRHIYQQNCGHTLAYDILNLAFLYL